MWSPVVSDGSSIRILGKLLNITGRRNPVNLGIWDQIVEIMELELIRNNSHDFFWKFFFYKYNLIVKKKDWAKLFIHDDSGYSNRLKTNYLWVRHIAK